MNQFFRRLRYLVNRRRFDQELAGELESIANWRRSKAKEISATVCHRDCGCAGAGRTRFAGIRLTNLKTT